NCFSRRPCDDYILEVLALYAATLGHLTSIRKSEDVLVAERTLFRLIIDTVPDLIFVKDTEGRFVMGNQAWWESVPGATREQDVVGKIDTDIVDDDLAGLYRAYDRKVIETGQPIVNIEEPSHNSPRILLTTKVPLKDANGKITGLVGVARDVSDLRVAERQAMEMAVELERVSILK